MTDRRTIPNHTDPTDARRAPGTLTHFWGEINGQRTTCACTKVPHGDWRTTGSIQFVDCPSCRKLIAQEVGN